MNSAPISIKRACLWSREGMFQFSPVPISCPHPELWASVALGEVGRKASLSIPIFVCGFLYADFCVRIFCADFSCGFCVRIFVRILDFLRADFSADFYADFFWRIFLAGRPQGVVETVPGIGPPQKRHFWSTLQESDPSVQFSGKSQESKPSIHTGQQQAEFNSIHARGA